MKLFVSVQTVPAVLKATMEGHVKYSPYLIDIPDELFPSEVIDAVKNQSDDKFICNTQLINVF